MSLESSADILSGDFKFSLLLIKKDEKKKLLTFKVPCTFLIPPTLFLFLSLPLSFLCLSLSFSILSLSLFIYFLPLLAVLAGLSSFKLENIKISKHHKLFLFSFILFFFFLSQSLLSCLPT